MRCRPDRLTAFATSSPVGAPRSRSGRSSLLLEHAGYDGQVLFAEPLINGLLPFLSQAGKDGEPVVADRLEGEVHVLERERQRELGRELALGDPLQLCSL